MRKIRKHHRSYSLDSWVPIRNISHRDNKRCSGRKLGCEMKEGLKHSKQHFTVRTKGRQNPNSASPKGITPNKETLLQAST